MLLRFMNPRYAQAPADAAGGGDTGNAEAEDVDQVEDQGDEGAKNQAEDKGQKDTGDDKGGKPEKKPASEKKAQEKGDKGKADEKKADPKKTLLGKKGGADDAAAAGKDKGQKGAADELDAWTPKLPEGRKLDEGLLGELRGVAKQAGLKGEQLQGFVDLGLKMQETTYQAFVHSHEKTVEGYEKAARADPEIGGAKLESEYLPAAVSAIKRFAGERAGDVIDQLERTGLGSHPEVIRFLAAVDKATSEDGTLARVRGKGGSPAKDDPMGRFTKAMYPEMQRQLAKERGEDVDDD